MARNREKTKGRREKGFFAILPHTVIQHPSVTSLTPAVKWVLVVVAAQYYGRNNGALAVPLSTAKQFGVVSPDTLSRGLKNLKERGLLVQTYPGSYHPPEPARYAITWKETDETEFSKKGPPTNDFWRWNNGAEK